MMQSAEEFQARIGLLIPPPNVTMEVEFSRWLPPTIAVHATRMYRSTSDVTVESLLEMARHANDAARLLAMTLPDVIIFGCTSGSLIMGLGWDQQILQGIEKTTDIRALTTSTAVVDALKSVGARKVAIATPYVSEVNLRERGFLESHGFEVLGIRGLEIVKSEQIARVPPSQVYQFVRGCDHPDADALFVSCTNFRTREVIDRLEQDLGKPVITSNQASLWSCLKAIGWGQPPAAGGRLLKEML
ncbi:MAG: maleate cis-trans isomerase family protein [Chloroflexota bacterium]